MAKRNCETCKYCWRDDSVGDRECNTDKAKTTEEAELLMYHYEEMIDNCPFYEEGEPTIKVGYSF